MDSESLNRKMREDARQRGLCDEWYAQWHDDTSIDGMLDKYVRGIDFVIKHDFPSTDTLMQHADSDTLHRHGIYARENVNIITEASGTMVFNGCSGTVALKGFAVANIYLRGNSQLSIVVDDEARAFVEAYDDSALCIQGRSDFRSFVYRHGGQVTAKGDVLIRQRS